MRGEKSDHRSTVQWCVKMVRYVSYINICLYWIYEVIYMYYVHWLGFTLCYVRLSQHIRPREGSSFHQSHIAHWALTAVLFIHRFNVYGYTCARDTLSEMATILCVLYYDILCGFLYNLHVQQEMLQVHYYICLKS